MAPHSSTLAWEIPWMEEPGRLQSMGSWRVRHNWATSLSLFTFMHWRRKWQPSPVFLPGESQGQEPGGLPSMGSHRVRHDWRDLAAAAATLPSVASTFPSFSTASPTSWTSLVAQMVKRICLQCRRPGLIPGSGRPPGEGNGNPPQYSCLGNPMDGRAWCATVHRVTNSWTWLSIWN